MLNKRSLNGKYAWINTDHEHVINNQKTLSSYLVIKIRQFCAISAPCLPLIGKKNNTQTQNFISLDKSKNFKARHC